MAIQSKKEYFQCYWRFIKPYVWREILAFFCVISTTLLGLTSPILMGLLIDHALTQKNNRLVYIILGVSLTVLVVQNMLSIVQERTFGYINNRLGYDLRMALFKKLVQREVLFFHKKNVGELMSRIVSEVRDVLNLFSSTLLRVSTEVISFVGTVGIMLYLNWQLTVISCLSIPLVMITMKYFNPRLRKGNRKVMESYAKTSSVLQENLQGIGIYKQFRKERYGALRFSQSLHNLIIAQMHMVYLHVLNTQALSYIYAIAPTALIVYGGKLVIDGVMTIGAFVAFYSYLGRLYGPVRSLSNLNVELQQTLVAFNRYYELLHSVSEGEDLGEHVTLDQIKEGIELKGVTFAYTEAQEKLLADFDLKLYPGEMIGIVGRNGIGKSTLFGLLSGQYFPEKGQVLLDGVSVRKVRKGSLQHLFGVVPQDSYLFNMTLLENITLGRRHLSLERIDELAEMLNIKDFIDSLPDKYETVAEKNGENFSGGQRQKIGIIRALIHDPQILFLDEATSAIDVQTEEAFFAWLAANKGDRIILYISHKPHLLKYADRIIRFEGYNEVTVSENSEMIS